MQNPFTIFRRYRELKERIEDERLLQIYQENARQSERDRLVRELDRYKRFLIQYPIHIGQPTSRSFGDGRIGYGVEIVAEGVTTKDGDLGKLMNYGNSLSLSEFMLDDLRRDKSDRKFDLLDSAVVDLYIRLMDAMVRKTINLSDFIKSKNLI